MTTIKSYTDLKQSKKLAEILPLESADMYYCYGMDIHTNKWDYDIIPTIIDESNQVDICDIPCWSLAALLGVLPEINCIPLTLEKVKAKDGYNGYYYPIEYEGIVLIPYSKNPIDACYEMILKLHDLNLL